MEKISVFKIAVGVFLGMAAWTHRSELGGVAIYLLGIVFALFVLIYFYRLITNSIKTGIHERRVDVLVLELHKHGLIEQSLVGAAQAGLKRFYYEQTCTELTGLLDSIKRKRKQEYSAELDEQKVRDLLAEVVEDFKQLSHA